MQPAEVAYLQHKDVFTISGRSFRFVLKFCPAYHNHWLPPSRQVFKFSVYVLGDMETCAQSYCYLLKIARFNIIIGLL